MRIDPPGLGRRSRVSGEPWHPCLVGNYCIADAVAGKKEMDMEIRTAIPILLVLLSGCAEMRPLHYAVKVDSIADQFKTAPKNYILLSAMKGVDVNDLQFKEFSSYVRTALALHGNRSVDNIAQAETAIFLSYGLGAPDTQNLVYSIPVFGATGGGSASFNTTTYGGLGAVSSTHGTITSQPQFGVVGDRTTSVPMTTYLRSVIIEAVDLAVYRSTAKIVPLWKTTILSRGTSSDLRAVFPILIGASADYIATDTGHQVTIELTRDDPRVERIKPESPPAVSTQH